MSEQLDVEPAKFTVIRHIRPQYACRACETVTAAPVPATVIDGGMATPALLAWVGTCHLPVEHCYAYLKDPTLADAILDRVLHAFHKLALFGES